MSLHLIGTDYKPPRGCSVVKDDPLNDDQKKRIKDYVEAYLLTDKFIEYYCYGFKIRPMNVIEQSYEGGDFEPLRALYKTYDSFDPASLEIAKNAMGAERFTAFRNTLKEPAKEAGRLGLDPNRSDQLFAAQIFMKQMIEGIHWNQSIEERHGSYQKKMVSARGRSPTNSQEISCKNKLLMQNDPLKKLTPGGRATPLDIILAHTYFTPSRTSQWSTYTNEKGEVTTEEKIYGTSREETRTVMIREITRLADDPELSHVVAALGTLILKEKGNICFDASSMGVRELAIPYFEQSIVQEDNMGFYTQNHTIMIQSMIKPLDQKINIDALSTFIHESLHFLFDRIVKNRASPVTDGSIEEKALDEALKRDREHRKNASFTDNERRILSTFTDIEVDYCSNNFDPSNGRHLRNMRVESIVRVMEQIAEGASRKDLETVAPNLCKFYDQYSKPLLEKFVKDNAALFVTV